MSDYAYPQTGLTFGARDSLSAADPDKLIRGSQFDPEFIAIETAIATKLDFNGGSLINGAVDATPVGAATPSTGAFTTLSASGAVTVPDGSFSIAKTTGLQAALDLKAPLASPTFTGTVTVPDASFTIAKTTDLQTALDLKAPIASPTFTGTVTVPTADINGGAIDGTVIGGTTPAAGDFTTLDASGAATADSLTLTKRGVAGTQTASITGATTLDFATYQNFVLTLTGNVTLDNPTTEAVGQSGFITFIQDATGGRTVSLGTDYETVDSGGLTLSSTASTTDIVPYVVVASGRILLGTPQLNFG